MIEVRNVTKRFGANLAVDQLSFVVRPGMVTGFLGPNGAGKSTTMRLILGLDRPNEGTALVNGRPYAAATRPLREVGALLEARGAPGGRKAYFHLLALAQSNGIPKRRVTDVLELVGLGDVARQRIGSMSLGMSQRLGVAAAMLGDPPVLLFDEPVNGLDPAGIVWMRELMKAMAAEGRTVFVSSHLMSEMAVTADHLIVIGRGQLLADSSAEELVKGSWSKTVVRSPQADHLLALLQAAGTAAEGMGNGYVHVRGATSEDVGELAARHGVVVHELFEQAATLEAAFMEMTGDSVQYEARVAAQGASVGGRP